MRGEDRRGPLVKLSNICHIRTLRCVVPGFALKSLLRTTICTTPTTHTNMLYAMDHLSIILVMVANLSMSFATFVPTHHAVCLDLARALLTFRIDLFT